MQASVLDHVPDQLGQARLDHRAFAGGDHRHLHLVHVDAPDVVTVGGQARRRDRTYVAETEHGNLHRVSAFLCHPSLVRARAIGWRSESKPDRYAPAPRLGLRRPCRCRLEPRTPSRSWVSAPACGFHLDAGATGPAGGSGTPEGPNVANPSGDVVRRRGSPPLEPSQDRPGRSPRHVSTLRWATGCV